jgi:hypothetical protein
MRCWLWSGPVLPRMALAIEPLTCRRDLLHLNRPRLGSWSIEQALSYSPVLHTNPSEKSTSTTRTRLRPTDVPKNLLWVRGSTIKGRCCLSHHTELRLVSMTSFISRFPKDETLIQNKFLSQYSVKTDFIAFFYYFMGPICPYPSLSSPLPPLPHMRTSMETGVLPTSSGVRWTTVDGLVAGGARGWRTSPARGGCARDSRQLATGAARGGGRTRSVSTGHLMVGRRSPTLAAARGRRTRGISRMASWRGQLAVAELGLSPVELAWWNSQSLSMVVSRGFLCLGNALDTFRVMKRFPSLFLVSCNLLIWCLFNVNKTLHETPLRQWRVS